MAVNYSHQNKTSLGLEHISPVDLANEFLKSKKKCIKIKCISITFKMYQYCIQIVSILHSKCNNTKLKMHEYKIQNVLIVHSNCIDIT